MYKAFLKEFHSYPSTFKLTMEWTCGKFQNILLLILFFILFSQADQEEAGYNSEDEYNHFGVQLTEEEWIEKDRKFEQTMRKKGKILKPNFNKNHLQAFLTA